MRNFGTLADAYNSITSSGTIEAKAISFAERLTIGREVVVNLIGGYSDDYGSHTGFTTLSGILTISGGSMMIDNVVIK